ncbi:Protease prsW [Slackia heliotrinireducens]|uniref:Protease PrsW n=1 Tax=Slackia heliotrinireducens (strain ATCC 29202 / DSM 20476 / NCTC 11029 / RHS 1) TaxID=471855 RepID=C7N3Q1_SLAHD|nr:PrsW family glutamic-type intramembrane protease [Slackia heliotrinireducens]ACV21642.1 predicted membrane protein [Slackia heliotrinireducens DSM 20476]VEG99224.1 Protease prsW [Slackia heliotrinireducens]
MVLLFGVIPPLLLLAYVWRIDRVESEPVGLVFKVLLFGGLSTIVAVLFETVGDIVLGLFGIPENTYLYAFLDCFIVVAISEELVKRWAMMKAVWRRPEFNYFFDAILYSVAAALGFALIENVEYIALFGGEVALGRLIPVHTICGVFMGYFLGMAKMCEIHGNLSGRQTYMVMSMLIPVLIHGFWDFALTTGSDLLTVLALLMVLCLTIYAFVMVHKRAKADHPLW